MNIFRVVLKSVCVTMLHRQHPLSVGGWMLGSSIDCLRPYTKRQAKCTTTRLFCMISFFFYCWLYYNRNSQCKLITFCSLAYKKITKFKIALFFFYSNLFFCVFYWYTLNSAILCLYFMFIFENFDAKPSKYIVRHVLKIRCFPCQ